jgi:integrase
METPRVKLTLAYKWLLVSWWPSPILGGTITRRNNLHRRSYKPPLKRAGLPDIRLYDLRRTFAMLMFENREQLKLVSKMFGTPR